MLDKTFYWGTTRKAIIAFGNLFNDIYIERKNSAGTVVQQFKVPLAYAPRQKMIARIEQQPNLDDQRAQIILPRMSFELQNLQYDPLRKVSPIQQNRAVNVSSRDKPIISQYAPTPYNLNILLYIYSKNQDDGLQILEQILPYFNPDFNLSLKAIPQLDIKNDLPVILDSVTYSDEYDGDFATRRAIIWTLSYTLKLNYYGPINKTGIIRRVKANIFDNVELTSNLGTYDVTVSPGNSYPNEDFDFVETFTDFE